MSNKECTFCFFINHRSEFDAALSHATVDKSLKLRMQMQPLNPCMPQRALAIQLWYAYGVAILIRLRQLSGNIDCCY